MNWLCLRDSMEFFTLSLSPSLALLAFFNNNNNGGGLGGVQWNGSLMGGEILHRGWGVVMSW